MPPVQDFTVESAALPVVERLLPEAAALFACEHLFRASPGTWLDEYPSHTAAVARHRGRTPPFRHGWRAPWSEAPRHYLAVCRLSPDPDPEPGAERLATGRDAAVAGALELLRAADLRAFAAQTGEGPFVGAEGLVEIGFRLHATSWRRGLRLSLCHVLVPK